MNNKTTGFASLVFTQTWLFHLLCFFLHIAINNLRARLYSTLAFGSLHNYLLASLFSLFFSYWLTDNRMWYYDCVTRKQTKQKYKLNNFVSKFITQNEFLPRFDIELVPSSCYVQSTSDIRDEEIFAYKGLFQMVPMIFNVK